MKRWFLFSLLLIPFGSCRWTPSSDLSLQVQLAPSSEARRPDSAARFDCYLVSVAGESVTPSLDSTLSTCLSLGKLSELVTFEKLRSGISFSVPSGKPLTIRAFGVEGRCPDAGPGGINGDSNAEMYEIGKTSTTGLYADSEITLGNTYSTSTPELLADCQEDGSEARELTLVALFKSRSIGDVFSGPLFQETVGTDYPPLDNGNNPMSEASPLSQFVGSQATIIASSTIITTPEHQRVDVLYEIPSTGVVSAASSILFKLSGAGGKVNFNASTGACGSDALTGGGYIAAPWNSTSSAFEVTNAMGTQSADDTSEQEKTFSPPTSFVVEEPTGSGNRYFHVSIRSRTAALQSSACSAIKLLSAKAYLVPASRR